MADSRVQEARKTAEELKSQIEGLRRDLKGSTEAPLAEAASGSLKPLNASCKGKRDPYKSFSK